MRGARLTMLSAMGLAYASLSIAAGDPGRGAMVFNGTCIACHGSDGFGSLPGVPDLTGRTGLLSQDDAVLLKRMTEGFQSPGSPMAMPPRGGDPALTDADLKAVLRYMRKEFKNAP
ncbi:c-type cytochrome [Thiobacillus denitrificans]|uniref:c-type cytochrome n=1 Tax=Thiobacillus denitrificans TaxID=36861 RepID=UPI00037EC843|nr:cytochrome c [Thiobacillus denitrificans]